MLPRQIIPSLLQKRVVVHGLELHPAALARDLTKDAVAVIAEDPVQGTFLGRLDVPRGDLVNVDVGQVVFGVFLDGERDSGKGDGTAEEPADALLYKGSGEGFLLGQRSEGGRGYHLENSVCIVGEGFVLQGSYRAVGEGKEGLVGGCTITHFPFRSLSVLFDGAAISATCFLEYRRKIDPNRGVDTGMKVESRMRLCV